MRSMIWAGVALMAVLLPAAASAQAITRGRVIVDRPKSTQPGTNCKIVNVRVVQPDGTAIMVPKRVCQ